MKTGTQAREQAKGEVLTDLTRQRRPKLPGLTGIRGYAACWVAIYHAGFIVAKQPVGAGLEQIPVIRSGYLGVDLFFMLSGFVLYLTYAGELRSPSQSALRTFAIGRVFRILPLHWFVVCCYVVLSPALGSFAPSRDSGWWKELIAVLLLIQSLLHMRSEWNPPSWSLSTEWLAYFAFPVLVIVVARIKDWRLCAALAAAGLAALSLICGLSKEPGLNHTQLLGNLRCSFELPAGMLLCRMRDLRPEIDQAASAMFAAGVVLFGVAMLSLSLDVLALPAFALLILSASNGSAVGGKAFGGRVPHFLGEISFSIYMLHVLLLELTVTATRSWTDQGAVIASLGLALSATLLLAWASWRLIEVPAQARGRLLARKG